MHKVRSSDQPVQGRLLRDGSLIQEEREMDRTGPMIGWLNDAYAMERSTIQILQNHARDAKDHPAMQARIEQHLEATRRHADLVKGCIERLGGSTSALKSGMATVMGTVQGMSTGLARDELVKNALHDYGTEYFEMASYKALIAAAQDIGDQETVSVCQQILRDEEAMAAWLDQQLPGLVVETLRTRAAPPPSGESVSTDSAPTA
jgi:ferritin-like metal-binding protein YciE